MTRRPTPARPSHAKRVEPEPAPAPPITIAIERLPSPPNVRGGIRVRVPGWGPVTAEPTSVRDFIELHPEACTLLRSVVAWFMANTRDAISVVDDAEPIVGTIVGRITALATAEAILP